MAAALPLRYAPRRQAKRAVGRTGRRSLGRLAASLRRSIASSQGRVLKRTNEPQEKEASKRYRASVHPLLKTSSTPSLRPLWKHFCDVYQLYSNNSIFWHRPRRPTDRPSEWSRGQAGGQACDRERQIVSEAVSRSVGCPAGGLAGWPNGRSVGRRVNPPAI